MPDNPYNYIIAPMGADFKGYGLRTPGRAGRIVITRHPGVTMNTLYYGDNLDILRCYVADDSVDLIYLDPPFNSNRSYNVLFKEAGKTTEATLR